ncbi:MAG TPA: response regulator [Candidatus Eisenbacteria bacterium]|nr:response regulator [Candidatus Eisenbacteria bacterium]
MAHKILLVDDETIILREIGAFLREAGYEVAEAWNGEEAVRRLSDNPFDLVIADLMMPAGDGLYLAERIRAMAPDVPVLLLSGAAKMGRGEAKKFGLAGFIQKPIVPQKFLHQVKKVLEER